MPDRGLFDLGTGSGFIAGGVRAGSIFQGETLSGRGILEISSHRTFRYNKISKHSQNYKFNVNRSTQELQTFKNLHLDSGHILGSDSSVPTMVPVNLQEKYILQPHP